MLAEKNENNVLNLCCTKTKISGRTGDVNSWENYTYYILLLHEACLLLLVSSNKKLKALCRTVFKLKCVQFTWPREV